MMRVPALAPHRCFYRLLLVLAVLLQATSLAAAQSFEDGLAALRSDNAPRAEEIWLALADQGDGQAQYALGTLYEQGHPGVPQDVAKAIIWYQKSVEQGIPSAENNLALIYATGRGVERDPANALNLWLSAANKGHVQAQYNAGLAFFRGSGVERDIGRASQLFQQAAAGGLADSQYALAQMYRLGIGVERNAQTSLFWYEQAAAQGHVSSQTEADELRQAGIVLDDAAEKTMVAEARAVAATPAPKAEPKAAEPKPAAPKPARSAEKPDAPALPLATPPAQQTALQQTPRQQAARTTGSETSVPPAPAGSYGLWVGSTRDRNAAQSLWGTLQGRGFPALSDKAYRIEPAGEGGNTLRVYATTWPDRAAAVSACLSMKEADPAIFCAPVALN